MCFRKNILFLSLFALNLTIHGQSDDYFLDLKIQKTDTINRKDQNGKVGYWIILDTVTNRIKQSGSYENGLRNGIWRTYHNNGFLKSKVSYENGYPNGMFFTYYENTVPEEIGVWKGKGYVGEFIRFYPSGAISMKKSFDSDHKVTGNTIYYWPNGMLQLIFSTNNGLENGCVFKYDSLGNMLSNLYFKDGVKIDSANTTRLEYQSMIEFANAEILSYKAKVNFERASTDLKISKIENEKNKSELDYQRRSRNYFIVGAIMLMMFVLIVLYFLFKARRDRKSLRLKNELIEEKNKEITDSINYAKRIQFTLLANDTFLNQSINEHFVFFKPKDIVSGDFYWATKIENTGSQILHEGILGDTKNNAVKNSTDTFFLSVCDSTGHGVPGAFMSLLNISFLNEAISERNILKPNEIFDYVRMRLVESVSQNGGKDGMDGILISKSEDTIFYAAANNSPILISDGKINELNKDKMPIGFGERKQSFSLNKIEYQKGDMLYLYTDGFADQFGGERGKKYKYKQLNEFLSSISTLSMDEQRVKLDEEFHRWKGELEQVDDVCVIGIRL